MVYWKRPSSPFISGILMLLSSSSTNFRVSAFTADTNTNNPLFLFLDTVRQAHSELLVLLPQHRRSSSCSSPTYWAVVLCTTNSTTLLSLKCTSSSCTHTSPGLCRWCGFYSQQVQRQQRWRIPETGGRRRRQARKSFWTHMYTHLEKGQRNIRTRIKSPPHPPRLSISIVHMSTDCLQQRCQTCGPWAKTGPARWFYLARLIFLNLNF